MLNIFKCRAGCLPGCSWENGNRKTSSGATNKALPGVSTVYAKEQSLWSVRLKGALNESVKLAKGPDFCGHNLKKEPLASVFLAGLRRYFLPVRLLGNLTPGCGSLCLEKSILAEDRASSAPPFFPRRQKPKTRLAEEDPVRYGANNCEQQPRPGSLGVRILSRRPNRTAFFSTN